MKKVKLRPQAISEIMFDLAYLIFAAAAGVFLFVKGGGSTIVSAYGILAIVLCFGDAFHLLPRVYALWTDTMELHTKALGFGKLVTSITMTVFYVMLYYIWQLLYQVKLPIWLTAAVLLLAAIRVLLCLCPQNGWLHQDPSFRFAVYRNIPFVILGAIVAILFAFSGLAGRPDGFRLMSLAIILSFAFYLAVVLFAGKYKKLGMLMLPKTCMYIWMISMGFYL